MVVCLVAGSGASEVKVGIGGNPCRPVRHRRGDASGCRRTFLEGVGGDPSSHLVVYLGKPLAAASSSSRSFLEVLIGTGASEPWSLVGDLRWTQWSLSFFVSVDPPLSAFFSLDVSLSFLLGVTVLLPPQHLFLNVSVGCFGIQSGGKPFFSTAHTPAFVRD